MNPRGKYFSPYENSREEHFLDVEMKSNVL